MSSAKQRTTLTNLSEPQQMRELNRQLSWIWDQLLGGLSMKSLSASARAVIDSKAGAEEVESLVRQSAEEILLEVRKPAAGLDTKSGVVINEKGVYVTGGEIIPPTGGGEEPTPGAKRGDVNGDNKIDSTDARLILQYAVGKIQSFSKV